MANASGLYSWPNSSRLRVRILRLDELLRDREHTARAGGRIINGTIDTRLEDLGLLAEDKVDHQANDLTRGEVVAGLLVGLLVELAHQLFKEIAHLQIGKTSGREVDQRAAELLDNEKEPVVLVELLDLGFKLKLFKDIAGTWRKAVDIGDQVAGDVGRVTQQFLEGKVADVVERLRAIAAHGHA